MGRPGLGTDQKKARRLKATIAFLDESGLMLQPLVQRTWALVGETPILRPNARRNRRVSVIGAFTVSPVARRWNLFVALHPDGSIRSTQVVAFLRQLLRSVRGSVIIVWDRSNTHRSAETKTYLNSQPRLHVEQLPAYAPDLNPQEQIWGHSKKNALANYCPDDTAELHDTAAETFAEIASNQRLLRGLFKHTHLPLRL